MRADGPSSSRRAAEPTSRRARERQETEPASSTPSMRAVLNALCEMPWPCAAVFRLLSPLVAHSARAWPFAVATATQLRGFKRSRLTGIGAPSSPSGSGHSAATEEPAQSMTLPPAFPHTIVWCVRRHTCSPVTRRSTRARQAQAAPGAHVGQSAPKTPSKRATRLATGLGSA